MSAPAGRNAPLVKIYGRVGSAEAYLLRDFLRRCDAADPLKNPLRARTLA